MFVTWHLSLLWQIPGVAVTFSHGQIKQVFHLNTNVFWHVAVLFQTHTVELKLFILQGKSNDYDIESKVHNTTYHWKRFCYEVGRNAKDFRATKHE